MNLYPLMAKLENCSILVVGGGHVATRKLKVLVKTGARIRVVSPELSPGIATLGGDGTVEVIQREFTPEDMKGVALVFAATGDPKVNDTIAALAQKKGIPVNNITNPETCTFFVPSQIARGDLILAISTSGRSPAVAKWLRKRLETQIGPEVGTLVQWVGTLRTFLLSTGHTTREISEISEFLLDGGLFDLLESNDQKAILSLLRDAFKAVLGRTVPEGLMTTLGLN